MLSCWEMSEMGSDIIEQKLSFTSRMAVMMHVGMCRHCRRYIKQLALTSSVLKEVTLPAQPGEIAAVIATIKAREVRQ